MAKLIYTATVSLDGYTENAEGRIDWSVPSQDVHSFINDRLRPIGTFLFGRRMYETMVYWETAHEIPGQPAIATDFANIWHAADKIVYSKTLQSASSARTRIERDFDVEVVQAMKSTARRDLSIGGAELAAQAIKHDLVDEFQLFVVPIVLGGGKRPLPSNVYVVLELLDERRFENGTVYLHYRSLS